MAATNVKIKTYSFSQDTLDKLDVLCEKKHVANKSKVLAMLVEAEYRKLKYENAGAELDEFCAEG
jgi:outer membrane protein assembly factor BamD (BamD/ComL family)